MVGDRATPRAGSSPESPGRGPHGQLPPAVRVSLGAGFVGPSRLLISVASGKEVGFLPFEPSRHGGPRRVHRRALPWQLHTRVPALDQVPPTAGAETLQANPRISDYDVEQTCFESDGYSRPEESRGLRGCAGMNTLVDGTIAALRANHDVLAELVPTLSEEQLMSASGATEWTVAQALSHLGSGAEITRKPIATAAG